MIDRISIKDNMLFKDVELEFDKNLIVFSGASGSGKSVLMNIILTLFGFKESDTKSIEATISTKLNIEQYGLENEDENIIRYVKQKSTRYFINGSQIPKRNIKEISKQFLSYLNLKEFEEFESKNIITLLDRIYTILFDSSHEDLIKRYFKKYHEYMDIYRKLEDLEEQEKKIVELKEFAKYEIEKIESISPKLNEYEELMEQKKRLSKKEKIEKALIEAEAIFEIEHRVVEVLSLLEEDETFFTEAMNELRIKLESATESLEELEGVDIESLLDRLEQLSDLKRKYGSIEESLEYLEEKKSELERYENLEFEKDELLEKKDRIKGEIENISSDITTHRQKALDVLNSELDKYCKELFLENVYFKMSETTLHEMGRDKVEVKLDNTTLSQVSSGEFNRIRLAFLSARSRYIQDSGTLILDEIDANLSGKESMSVAKVLKELSKNYQIFAISHQPQLSSQADEHFLVYKEDGQSYVKKLDMVERERELARMISGEEVDKKALDFARKMLEG